MHNLIKSSRLIVSMHNTDQNTELITNDMLLAKSHHDMLDRKKFLCLQFLTLKADWEGVHIKQFSPLSCPTIVAHLPQISPI